MDDLVTWATNAKIRIRPLPAKYDKLFSETGHNLNKLSPVVIMSKNAVVSYIRHKYTNYENHVVYLKQHNENETDKAYNILRSRFDEAIEDRISKQYS